MRLFPLRRRRQDTFARAADGSMTLMEHLYELRDRLFKASVGIVAGMIVGYLLSSRVLTLLQQPYCTYSETAAREANGGTLPADYSCGFVQLGVADVLLLNLKIAMWLGLIIAAPIWLYQLWAFVAPGLHRHERRWTYAFAAIAAPLFAAGAVLAYYVITFGLHFLLSFAGEGVETQLEITRYVDFITGMMLIFGVAFEFPLAAMLLNVAGLVSARKLLGWWRIAVFAFFAFAAVATPTADPFGMTLLGAALSGLYFAAVGFAFLNDKRRNRRRAAESYAQLDDDEASPLEHEQSTELPSGPVDGPEPVHAPAPLDRHYDDIT